MHTLWDKLSAVVPWSMPFFREKVHSALPRVVVQCVLRFAMYPVWRKLKRKRDRLTDQNIRRGEGASGSRPKLKIIRSENPSRPLISTSEDDLLQDKIPGIGVAILVTSISAIPIQSVAMTAKPPDEVRFTPDSSPAVACRQKLKSIIVCTLNEQGMSSIQGNMLTSEKAIFHLRQCREYHGHLRL